MGIPSLPDVIFKALAGFSSTVDIDALLEWIDEPAELRAAPYLPPARDCTARSFPRCSPETGNLLKQRLASPRPGRVRLLPGPRQVGKTPYVVGIGRGPEPQVAPARQSGYSLARMRYEIILAPAAVKALRRLPAHVRRQVRDALRSEEHTSELQSPYDLV